MASIQRTSFITKKPLPKVREVLRSEVKKIMLEQLQELQRWLFVEHIVEFYSLLCCF